MTERLFFDTDCLSSFLWVGRADIILKNYEGRIVVPQYVYEEFCRPGVIHLRKEIDQMLAAKSILIMDIIHGTEEAKLFRELTKTPHAGNSIIGKGEASALALARFHDGIVASNNLKDVKKYVLELNLTLVTTADILVEAFTVLYINESAANKVWADMLKKQRRLPANSFSEYLRTI